MISAIVTMPPYAPYIDEVLRHPAVSGIRLNTVMPVKDNLEELLESLDYKARRHGKKFWIDLKCRQLRVKSYGVPPFTEIELTHKINVETPVTAYFSNGTEAATVLQADGNKLIMQEGPRRVVGPGEAVNIMHPSLKIEGYFTETDRKYMEAAKNIGLHRYMLSFVEREEDIEEMYRFDREAEIIAKIESQKGLDYIKNRQERTMRTRLMAARGDLFVELKFPHQIIEALESIYRADINAIVASRLFSSLSRGLEPSCEDIGDADNLLRMGYKTFMFGDDICMERDSIISGLNLFNAMAERYRRAE